MSFRVLFGCDPECSNLEKTQDNKERPVDTLVAVNQARNVHLSQEVADCIHEKVRKQVEGLQGCMSQGRKSSV